MDERVKQLKKLLSVEPDKESLKQRLKRLGEIAALADQAILLVSISHKIEEGEICEHCEKTHEAGDAHAFGVATTILTPQFVNEAAQVLVEKNLELSPLSGLMGLLATLGDRPGPGEGPEEEPSILNHPPVDPLGDFPHLTGN